MALIGMPDAGKELGISPTNAKRTLESAGIALVQINGKAWAVEEKDLQAFKSVFRKRMKGYSGRGRPKEPKNENESKEKI